MREEAGGLAVSLISLYDLLTRVIPGSIALIALLWSRQVPLSSVAKELGFEDPLAAYVALLASGFVVGILLTAIAAAVVEIMLQTLARLVPTTVRYTNASTWRRIDAIDRRSAQAAAILAKLAAEVSLCQNLLLVAVLTFVLSARPIGTLTSLLILLVGLFAWVARYVTLQHRIASYESQWLNAT